MKELIFRITDTDVETAIEDNITVKNAEDCIEILESFVEIKHIEDLSRRLKEVRKEIERLVQIYIEIEEEMRKI